MFAVDVSSFRQYRVPSAPGTALVDPAQRELSAYLEDLDLAFQLRGLEFCGKSIEHVRRQAREEIIEIAVHYSNAYRNVPNLSEQAVERIVLSGHQPELFHAGVWFKNFLLSELTQSPSAIAINFLVDNDLCRSTAIRVPTRNADGSLVSGSVAFDEPRDAIPWELRHLDSQSTFASFPDRVGDSLPPLIDRPLIYELWPSAVQAVARSGRVGFAIAEARHRLEEAIGLQTLEAPLSQLVSTRAFARFSIQLLSELPRLQESYNSQLDFYRTAHRIRSQAHPVPALDQRDEWLEAPFWVYRPEAPYRRRLWVRSLDEQLILSDGSGWQTEIQGRFDCDNASSHWLEILADGVCLRPRALLTTMYLRLIVGDLFVHGIGGGKYDQLTDLIIRDFFGVEPPRTVVATATCHLPFADSEIADMQRFSEADGLARMTRQRAWFRRFHAEQLESGLSAEAEELAERKRQLLANIPARGAKWNWHREITAVNKRLSELVGREDGGSAKQLELLGDAQRQNRVMTSREYSFCLYPKDFLTNALSQLASS